MIIYYYLRRLFALFSLWRYDIVWIEKELFPYLPAFAERALKFFNKPYIVDYDDATFHSYDLSDNYFVRRLLRRKIDVVMREANYVVAGNPYLLARAKSAGAKLVKEIPTVVDYNRYSSNPLADSAPLTIGWIGSPSTQKYILEVIDALREACTRHNAIIMLIGATPAIINSLEGIRVIVLPWTEESEVRLIQKMDIGIMPLRDGPWESGKCGYKLIQYMACSIPVIGSSVGVNVEIIGNSACGYLASNHKEWLTALESLLSSKATRKMFGQAGRKAVEETYSLQAQGALVAEIFHLTFKKIAAVKPD